MKIEISKKEIEKMLEVNDDDIRESVRQVLSQEMYRKFTPLVRAKLEKMMDMLGEKIKVEAEKSFLRYIKSEQFKNTIEMTIRDNVAHEIRFRRLQTKS